jgi:hypothetical protein
MLLRLFASKAVRKSALILVIAIGGAVWGLPPEAIDVILAAIGQ